MNISQIKQITGSYLKSDLPDIKVGDTIKVYTKVKENKGVRNQGFEGVVLEMRHGGVDTTMVVRKLSDSSVFVEKIFALHSPAIDKIEIIKKGNVRRAKLRYLRNRLGKQALLVKTAK